MKWLILLSLLAAMLLRPHGPTLRIRSGFVRGTLSDDGLFYQYLAIPYATVTDDNRFQAPLPAPEWAGVYDAVDENIRCPQKIVGTLVVGVPDCLKLNVHTPVQLKKKLLPVMVYIHGGCFFEGTGSSFLYGADYFVREDVVFVSISYRLNIEGFLCLGIKEAPGNAGLKDQIAALKWVKENIKVFGGDPDNVTLFGESAGAVSTSFMILSPLAKGLFHKAILQSGATLTPWSLQHQPIETASALAKEMGYNTKDPHHLYEIFRNKTYDELIRIRATTYRSNSITSDLLFVPCIEKVIPGVEPIITQYPTEVIKANNYNKVPMIIGFNDKEGIYFVAHDYGTSLPEVDVAETLQPDLEFASDYDKRQVSDAALNHYFGNTTKDKLTNMIDLYSDVYFKYPIVIESELYAKNSDNPIYYYIFKYSGSINMAKIISRLYWLDGASHADELFYMFKPHSFPLPHSFTERFMIKRMVTMWTNFAKYGNPTPTISDLLPVTWSPSKAHNPRALVIDGSLTTSPWWEEADMTFWNKTYKRFRRKNYGFHKSESRLCLIN